MENISTQPLNIMPPYLKRLYALKHGAGFDTLLVAGRPILNALAMIYLYKPVFFRDRFGGTLPPFSSEIASAGHSRIHARQ